MMSRRFCVVLDRRWRVCGRLYDRTGRELGQPQGDSDLCEPAHVPAVGEVHDERLGDRIDRPGSLASADSSGPPALNANVFTPNAAAKSSTTGSPNRRAFFMTTSQGWRKGDIDVRPIRTVDEPLE